MSAEDFAGWLTTGTFLVLLAATAANALRARTRLATDTALLFAALAATVGAQQLRVVRIADGPVIQDAVVALVALIPYLNLRLAQDFWPVPRLVLWLALAAGAGLAVMTIVAPVNPPGTGAALALNFFGFGGYAAWVFLRRARRATGATRVRLLAAAGGSLFLALTVILAGLRTALPGLAAVSYYAFALVSGIAYVHAFAPPSFARRAWREPHLRELLRAVARASSRADTPAAVAELESCIAVAMSAERGQIVLADAEPPSEAAEVLRAALDSRRGVSSEGATGSLVAAPIVAEQRVLGGIVVHLGRSQSFPEESIALLELFAEQAAIVLESARLRDDVAAASRAKSEFLANMSHELRTPLNAILGFSALMRESATLTTEKRERYLANITDAGEHLLALVNDVLDLSTVEAGRIDLRLDRTSLAALVGPAVAAARSAADVRGVAFSSDVRGGDLVRVDAQRLRQVLHNLLSNAVKFTPAGGSVRLSVGLDGEDLVAEVADSGIGIPADRHSRVFALFERVNEDRSDASGTGLGLALTKRLVELHGGTLTFESAAGAGATFRVRLPGVRAEAVSGERVLIVEDEERDAHLIRALAAELGLRCEVVTTVEGALGAVERDPPLGVVLDLRLPDGRGEEVLAAIRAAPSTRSLPVGVVTVEDDAPAARALGASLMLTKPIDVRVLSAWLAGLRPTPARAAS